MKDEETLTEEELQALSHSKLLTEGLTDDISNLECTDYTDADIRADIEAVDFDSAYEQVLEVQEQQRRAQLQLIQEQERRKAQEEFERLQQEEAKRSEEVAKAFEEKQKVIEKQKQEMEEKMRAAEMQARQELESHVAQNQAQ